MSNSELAQQLTKTLQLESPAIAIAFVRQPPAHISRFEGVVPAGCAFWQKAVEGTFYADVADHENCPVGVHTLGLPLSEAIASELGGLIVKMGEACYLDGAEVPNIPTVPGEKSGVVYGLLAEFELKPDVVLVWVTPQQAMLLQEATKASAWSTTSGSPTFGRPGCAAIPAALQNGSAVLSLGCTGMRTFTNLSQNLLLAVLPHQVLDDLTANLQQIAIANQQMQEFYNQKNLSFVNQR